MNGLNYSWSFYPLKQNEFEEDITVLKKAISERIDLSNKYFRMNYSLCSNI